jgi:hypothetical protein
LQSACLHLCFRPYVNDHAIRRQPFRGWLRAGQLRTVATLRPDDQPGQFAVIERHRVGGCDGLPGPLDSLLQAIQDPFFAGAVRDQMEHMHRS